MRLSTFKSLTGLFSLLLALSFFFSSCKKEAIAPTPAEKTQEQLEKTIAEKSVKKVYAFNYPGGGWTTLPAATSWTFSNGYITLHDGSNQTWNLDYLYNYTVGNVSLDDGSTALALLLYFK